jgi:ABC-type uncharacterized transport system auxiliary subunit
MTLALMLISTSAGAADMHCTALHVIENTAGKVYATYKINIKDNKGVFNIDARFEGDDDKKMISRQIFLTAERISDTGYVFTAKKIKTNPSESIKEVSSLINFYPDFFWQQDKSTAFSIKRHENSHIMSWSAEPMFFCF